MYDGTKFHIHKPCIESILSNSLLEFHSKINLDTAEVKENKLVANYNGFKITILNKSYVLFQGSVHKYWNRDDTNYNDFTLFDYNDTLTGLASKFDLNPFSCQLHNLEFGVNVNLPFPIETFLNNLISFKGKEPEITTFEGKGKMVQFNFPGYYTLKIYNKGLQYGLSENIVRFEIKVRKMYYFKSKRIHINNLTDLLNPNVINQLREQLVKSFNELMIYDNSISIEEIKEPNERELILNGRNPKYWVNLCKNKPESFKKKRGRFRELVNKYGRLNRQKTVLNLIESKLEYLINYNPNEKQLPDLTDVRLLITQFDTLSILSNPYLQFKHTVFGRPEVGI